MRMSLDELMKELSGAGPQKVTDPDPRDGEIVGITDDTPVAVGGDHNRTICKFKHVGRVVQHAINGSDNVPMGGTQNFIIAIANPTTIDKFVASINKRNNSDLKTIEDFFASEFYLYETM